jgi:hypothetical protein
MVCFLSQPFVCWIVWLVAGSAYYSRALDMGCGRGFYMAVNVGYSIGWGYPVENSDASRVFSTFYVLIGASAVAASLGYFAQTMIASSKDWYAKALEQEKFAKATSHEKFIVYLRMNDSAFRMVAVWLLWILAMIIFSLVTVKWDFTEALYFAISSLSTGGLWAIPSDSPDWYFGVGRYIVCCRCRVLPHIVQLYCYSGLFLRHWRPAYGSGNGQRCFFADLRG